MKEIVFIANEVLYYISFLVIVILAAVWMHRRGEALTHRGFLWLGVAASAVFLATFVVHLLMANQIPDLPKARVGFFTYLALAIAAAAGAFCVVRLRMLEKPSMVSR